MIPDLFTTSPEFSKYLGLPSGECIDFSFRAEGILRKNGQILEPDYIHVCHHDDPNLADCIKESVEALRPRIKSGIPELEVPPIEPLTLDVVSFKTSSEAAHLATNITKLKVWGASNFKIIKLIPTLSKKEHTFNIEVVLPKLYIEGDYAVNSRVLLLEIRGHGPFSANASDVQFECLIKGKKIQKNAANYLELDQLKCDVILGKTAIDLKNLFNGHPVLQRATNEAINGNAEAFFDEIKPSLVEALTRKFTDIGNKITLNFKYEELFP